MATFARHYPEWKAPSEDGDLVIWPEPRDLLRDTQANQARLKDAEPVRLQGVALPEARRRMRQFIGHDDAEPLIATGHQTELYHPGVWVKQALINAAASRLGGRACHIAVDTDAPKHLHLRWPPSAAIPVTDDPAIATAAWSGALAPPTPAHVQRIAEELRAASASWGFRPALSAMLDSLRRLSIESLDLPAAITNAMHELDWKLGLRQHALLASPIWMSEPFLLFVHDLLANADSVASHYNTALGAYREAHGVRSRMRPMPDLFVSGDAVEAPFWLDDLHSAQRTRPSVFQSDRGWVLELVGGEEFVFERNADGWEAASRLQRWLSSTRHRIAPRALTLTMFFRLLMVDQFVHGIGGGRYDQVTDQLIAGHYGIEPPRFSVTTATLYFPAAVGRERVCVPCVQHEGHRLKHALLGDRKRELVTKINAMPRRSPQRSTTFFEMHNELAAAASSSRVLEQWQEKFRRAQAREKEEQTLFDRELFYAIQPEDRLRELIERYNARFL